MRDYELRQSEPSRDEEWVAWVEWWAHTWSKSAQSAIEFFEGAQVGSLGLVPAPEPGDYALPGVIRERILTFAEPINPASIQLSAADMKTATGEIIEPVDELLNAKDVVLATWEGDAATDFRQYLTSMSGATHRIQALIEDVSLVTQGYAAIVTGMRNDLGRIFDNTTANLEAERSDPWEVALGVVAAIGTVVAGVATAGTATAALGTLGGYTTMTAGGASLAQSLFGSSNELEVWREFALALRYLREDCEKEIARVVAGYVAIIDYLRTPEKLPQVNPDAPKLITQKAFDPGGFSLPDEPVFQQGKGRIDSSDLVPSPKRTELDQKLNPVR